MGKRHKLKYDGRYDDFFFFNIQHPNQAAYKIQYTVDKVKGKTAQLCCPSFLNHTSVQECSLSCLVIVQTRTIRFYFSYIVIKTGQALAIILRSDTFLNRM